MKKIVQFILLIIFMMLINLIGHLIGILFIDGYSKFDRGHFYFFESLFFISIYSAFQIFVFPINKKYREYIIPICTLFSFFILLYDSFNIYGSEFMSIIVFLISKIITLFSFIGDDITNDSIRYNFINLLFSCGYSIYLLTVFSSFKYIMKYLGRKYSLFDTNVLS
jgi:hypothetical protein